MLTSREVLFKLSEVVAVGRERVRRETLLVGQELQEGVGVVNHAAPVRSDRPAAIEPELIEQLSQASSA